MSTTTLPEKWAVEITSLEDAERLQKLFPNDVSKTGSSLKKLFAFAFTYYGISTALSKICADDSGWGFSTITFYSNNGYTIYTITELETILKQINQN